MATKWGIVGTGKISEDFVTVVKSLNGKEHEFIAVSSRNLGSAQTFAAAHGIPKAYGSIEELAHDEEIDVVYVASINSQHFRMGKLMLENGKHVLMEKPMTINLQQTKELVEIARSNKLFLMEALWSSFLPSYKCLMDLIQGGSIGDVVHVQANLGANLMYSRRNISKDQGKGILFDLGIYPLNAVAMIYNGEKPLKIAAVGHLNEDGVDITVACSLKYNNNRTANITSSALTHLPGAMVITGTKGKITVPKSMNSSLTIETSEKTYTYSLPELEVSTNYPISNGLIYEAKEVRECLRKSLLESPLMPHKDSEMLAEIMDEIRRQIGVQYPPGEEGSS